MAAGRGKNTGIYQIKNKKNGKCYIGSGVNIANRWSVHKVQLKKKTHHSSKLQRAWNKYEAKNFQFKLIELCSKLNLIKREQHYIDKFDSYHNGYNVQPIAGSCLGVRHNKEFRQKLRRAQLRICRNPKEIKRRSIRAKKQHKEKNFGRHTWKNKSTKVSLAASKTLKKLWKNTSFRKKMIAAIKKRNKLGLMKRKPK